MRALSALLIFVMSVARAEETPRTLLEAVFPYLLEASWPILPSLPSEIVGRIGSEIAASEAIRKAFRDLNPKNSNAQWFDAIDVLEHEHAIWSLQACLCHRSLDVQVKAIRALGRLKDARSVHFLLVYADYMAISVMGSENATVHGFIHGDLAVTLSAITGIQVSILGQDPEGLKKAIRKWQRWELDHVSK